MKKKYVIIGLFGLVLIGAYVKLFHKNYEIASAPISTEKTVLIDIKNLKWLAIKSAISDLQSWSSRKGDKDDSWLEAGIKTPDFIAVYQLQSKAWVSVFELDDTAKLKQVLGAKGFKANNEKEYSKGGFTFYIEEKHVLIQYGNSSSNKPQNLLAEILKAGKVSCKSMVSGDELVSILKNKRRLSITADEYEINIDGKWHLASKVEAFEFETSQEGIASFGFTKALFNEFIESDIKEINTLKKLNWRAISGHLNALKSKEDTFITYEYDEDFNEVEKKTTQTVYQPNYDLAIYTAKPLTLFDSLITLEWIDSKTQFVKIPFLPNSSDTLQNSLLVKNYDGSLPKRASTPVLAYLYFDNSLIPKTAIDSSSLIPKDKKALLKSIQKVDINYNPKEEINAKILFDKNAKPWILNL